jgi:hypothetical protein
MPNSQLPDQASLSGLEDQHGQRFGRGLWQTLKRRFPPWKPPMVEAIPVGEEPEQKEEDAMGDYYTIVRCVHCGAIVQVHRAGSGKAIRRVCEACRISPRPKPERKSRRRTRKTRRD